MFSSSEALTEEASALTALVSRLGADVSRSAGSRHGINLSLLTEGSLSCGPGGAEASSAEVRDAVIALCTWADGSLDALRVDLCGVALVLALSSVALLAVRAPPPRVSDDTISASTYSFAPARDILTAARALASGGAGGAAARDTVAALSAITDPHSQLFSGLPLGAGRAARVAALLGAGPGALAPPDAVFTAITAASASARDVAATLGADDAGVAAAAAAGGLSKRAAAAAVLSQSQGGGQIQAQLPGVTTARGALVRANAAEIAGSLAPPATAPPLSDARTPGTPAALALARLVDPTLRADVFMGALALKTLLEWLARESTGGRATLLALLNERVRVSVRVTNGFSSIATATANTPGVRPRATDVVVALARATSSTTTSSMHTLAWGVPFASLDIFIGTLKRSDIPMQWADTSGLTMSLAGAAMSRCHAATTAAVAVTGITQPTAAAATATATLHSTGVRAAVVADAGDALRALAGVAPLATVGTVLSGTGGARVLRVVVAGFTDGVISAWLTVGGGAAMRPVNVALTAEPAAAAAAGATTVVAVSACGGWAVSGHAGGAVALWPLAARAALQAAAAMADARAAGLGGVVGATSPLLTTTASSASASTPAPPFRTSLLSTRTTSGALGMPTFYHSGGPVWAASFNPLHAGLWATGGRGGAAAVWSWQHSEPHRLLCASGGGAGDVTALGWHPAGALLLVGTADGAARVWDVSTGVPLRAFFQPGGPSPRVACLSVSPGGRFAAMGDDEGRISLWDLPSGARVACLAAPPPPDTVVLEGGGVIAGKPPPPRARRSVAGLQWSRDGRTLLSAAPAGSRDTHLATWDICAAVTNWESKTTVISEDTLISESAEGAPPHSSLRTILRLANLNAFALYDAGDFDDAAYLVLGAKG